MGFYTYLLVSKPYGTLYCGHTDDLGRRIWEHKAELRDGFTRKYGVHRLVWYEFHETREGAKRRERQIKKWNRAWKIRMILEANPHWEDLLDDHFNRGTLPVEEWLKTLPPTESPREGGDPSDAPDQG